MGIAPQLEPDDSIEIIAALLSFCPSNQSEQVAPTG